MFFNNKKKLVKSFFFIGISLLLLQTGCKSKKLANDISDEVVLKIDSAEITRYEFEVNKERSYDPKSNYQHWLESYIDEAYILADAYKKKNRYSSGYK